VPLVSVDATLAPLPVTDEAVTTPEHNAFGVTVYDTLLGAFTSVMVKALVTLEPGQRTF
jgi:hypothetical protein